MSGFKTALAAVGGLILFVVLIVAIWGFGIWFAGPQGQAGAYKKKVSATNRVQKQEMFEQLNADIDGYVAKIDVAKAAVKADPSEFNKINLVGAEQQCIDTVQQFNAESHKYSSRDWKSTHLPYSRHPAECR